MQLYDIVLLLSGQPTSASFACRKNLALIGKYTKICSSIECFCMGHWIVEIIGIPKYDITHSIFMKTGLQLYFDQSYEIKLPSQAFLVRRSSPRVSIQGVKSLWGDRIVFPRLGTGDTDRWQINLCLCATCQCTGCPISEQWRNPFKVTELLGY